jgi:hypothetical protein
MVSLILLLTQIAFAIPAAPSSAAIPALIQRLQQLKVWPGMKFSNTCPAGFHMNPELDHDFADLVPEDYPYLECIPNQKTDSWSHLLIRRSGDLMSSMELELPPLPGDTCAKTEMQGAFADRSPHLIIEFSDNRRSQVVASETLDQEIEVTLTCSKAKGILDNLIVQLQTPYSLLGQNGNPTHGKISTGETEHGEHEPYGRPGALAPKSLGPLAKRLLQDNVNWLRVPNRIARRSRPKSAAPTVPLAVPPTKSPAPQSPPNPHAVCVRQCQKNPLAIAQHVDCEAKCK